MIREPVKADQPYLCATWMRSLGVYADTVNRILDTGPPDILIACDDRSPEVINGWVCYSVFGKSRTLHYVYVRGGKHNTMRGQGIGRKLVEAAGFDLTKPIPYTCAGPDAKSLLKRYSGVLLPLEEFLK